MKRLDTDQTHLRAGFAILVLASLIAILPSGCYNRPKAPQHIRILFTTDTLGYVTGSDGTGGPEGGMERRATAIAEARSSAPGPVVLIDTGNFISGAPGDASRAQGEYVSKAMGMMGYDAVNVGKYDAEHSRADLMAFDKPDQGFPLTSIAFATKSSTESEKPESSYPVSVLLTRDKFRIGILGHPLDDLNQSALGSENIFNPDPGDLPLALEDVSIKDNVEMLILVSDFAGSWQDTHFRASRYSLASVIIAGESAPANYVEEKQADKVQHPVIVPRALAWGRSLGVLDLDLTREGGITGYKLHYVDLNDKVAKDPALAALTQEYIAAMNVPPAGVPDMLQAGYMGSAACQKCHAMEYTSWMASPHANAWATLEKSGRLNEAVCAPCHSTGYAGNLAYPSSMISTELHNVGCESCHGEGRAHVSLRSGGNASQGAVDTIVRKPLESACIRCHQFPYDEGWMYGTKLSRIKHGSQ